MYGVQAVTAHNGWAMAAAGAIIVMCGLSVLAFIISQLHKIIGVFEERKKTPAPVEPEPVKIDPLRDPAAAADLPGDEAAEAGGVENALREAGYILPAEEGLFCWKKP